MKKLLVATSTLAIALAARPLAGEPAGPIARKVVAVTPAQVRWFTPSYYKDGRQRAQLLGDSGRGGDRSVVGSS